MSNQKMRVFIGFACLLSVYLPIYTAKTEELLKIGNFLLPTSQMPGPLFGFGQNVVDKHDFQVYFNVLQSAGKHVNYTDLIPGFLYGIRNDLSLFVGIPATPSYKNNDCRSKGMEDIFTQLEYVYLTSQTETAATQATILGNITIPTGSSKKNPPTGYGSPSFFLGTTLSHTAQFWMAWIQAGTTLTLKHHNYKHGNLFYYQSGLEAVITTTKKWIIAGIVEFFGVYEQRTKICNRIDCDTGGHTFYIGPSFWASSPKWIFQIGIAGAPAQHLFGNQNKIQYFFETYINYKFN